MPAHVPGAPPPVAGAPRMPSTHPLLVSVVAAVVLGATTPSPALAHERRQVGDYQFVVGFIGEPVFTGQKSGLEFQVTRDGQPVEGLEEALQAEVTYREQRRDLPLGPRFGEAGWYQSVFFPTAAGPYTFHIHGEIDGDPIAESFTSSPEGFDEVQELGAGQFPVQFPAQAELVADAERGARAAGQVVIALVLGAGAMLIAIVALGLSLATRRRAS